MANMRTRALSNGSAPLRLSLCVRLEGTITTRTRRGRRNPQTPRRGGTIEGDRTITPRGRRTTGKADGTGRDGRTNERAGERSNCKGDEDGTAAAAAIADTSERPGCPSPTHRSLSRATRTTHFSLSLSYLSYLSPLLSFADQLELEHGWTADGE